jgi:redox-sensing transcriptional repressor
MVRLGESAVRRLLLYLRFLEEFEARGIETVSSETLAIQGGTSGAQVRKDLSFLGSFGKRGVGYPVRDLAQRLREILGLKRSYRVLIVGAGRIGSALAGYRGLGQRGFDVAALYDSDPAKIGSEWEGQVVRDVSELERDLAREPMDIAIVSTPAAAAQAVTDRLVRAGIKAILNFAPVRLRVPRDVVVRNVNLAMELEALSYALRNR